MRELVVGGAAMVALAAVARATRKREDIPAQVSKAADGELARTAVDPCSGGGGRARDYTELFVEQKKALIAKFGGAMAFSCSASGFGPCLPDPSKSIPTAPAGCTLSVVKAWSGIARRIERAGETPASLRDDLTELADALDLQAALLRGMPGAGAVVTDVNRRVWSTIARLSIALAGAHIHHGDAEAEARAELARTLTSPSSYTSVVADGLGTVAGAASRVVGDAAAGFLSTGLGAAVAIGAVVLIARGRIL